MSVRRSSGGSQVMAGSGDHADAEEPAYSVRGGGGGAAT